MPESSIKNVQSQCTQKIKGWLGLTRGVTNAVMHHPNVIGIATIAKYRTKAKLTFLSSILTSKDPMINEISELLLDQDFTRSQRIPSEVNQVLDLAKNSISTITTKTLSHKCSSVHRDGRVKHWNDKRSKLTVQCKFNAITELESRNNVWRHIQKGMPARQLSFLLREGSDTLPTPLNLRRWRLRPDAKCPLCDNPWPTVQHILNGCPASLSQGRYTWRHDRALKILANGLRKCLQP